MHETVVYSQEVTTNIDQFQQIFFPLAMVTKMVTAWSAAMVMYWSIPLINPWSTLDQNLVDSLSRLTQGSTNFWLMHMSWSTLSRLLTDCWSSINRVPNKILIKNQLSVDRVSIRISISRFWSSISHKSLRTAIDTQPQMHLVHMFHVLSVHFVYTLQRKQTQTWIS